MNLLRDFLQKYKTGSTGFSAWLRVQQRLQQRSAVKFNEREVWWCAIGVNVGYEIDGKGKDFARPVLVLKKVSNENFIGSPITSVVKNLPGYHQYKDEFINGSFVFEQARALNSRRLLHREGIVSKKNFNEIYNSFLNYMSPHKRGPAPSGDLFLEYDSL